MKKVITLVSLLLIFAFALTGCVQPDPVKLTTPQNLRINNNVLEWDSVENASGYVVKADGTDYQAQTNSYLLDSLPKTKDYTFSVKAVGDGKDYLDSDWSQNYHTDWLPKVFYTVTYDFQKGSGAKPTETVQAEKNYVLQTPSRQNFSFGGWYDEIGGGGVQYTDNLGNSIINCKSDITLYAYWLGTSGITYSENSVAKANIASNVSAVYVQEYYLGIEITRINDTAFLNCGANLINIPAATSYIGISAFENCKSLTTINLPEAISFIGSKAFLGCSVLDNVTIPAAITQINAQTFENCRKLQTIIFPTGLLEIGNRTFMSTALSDITLPASLTTIGEQAFAYNSKFKNLIIPENVESIGKNAFEYCTFETVTFAGAITNLSERTFYGVEATGIVLPEGVEILGDYLFGESKIGSLTLGGNIQTWGESVFFNLIVDSLVFRSSQKNIPAEAFYCFERTIWIFNAKIYITFEQLNQLARLEHEKWVGKSDDFSVDFFYYAGYAQGTGGFYNIDYMPDSIHVKPYEDCTSLRTIYVILHEFRHYYQFVALYGTGRFDIKNMLVPPDKQLLASWGDPDSDVMPIEDDANGYARSILGIIE